MKQSECGEIGRHKRLKISRLTAYQFDSGHSYHIFFFFKGASMITEILTVKEAWLKANDALDKIQEAIDDLDEYGSNISVEDAEILYELGEVFDELERAITPLEKYFDMDKI